MISVSISLSNNSEIRVLCNETTAKELYDILLTDTVELDNTECRIERYVNGKKEENSVMISINPEHVVCVSCSQIL